MLHYGGPTAFSLELMNFYKLGSSVSIDFSTVILTSLAHIIPSSSLWLNLQSFAWCLVVDLCIWFCQLLNEGSKRSHLNSLPRVTHVSLLGSSLLPGFSGSVVPVWLFYRFLLFFFEIRSCYCHPCRPQICDFPASVPQVLRWQAGTDSVSQGASWRKI